MDYLMKLEKALDEAGYKKRYKKLCLSYAKRLIENDLPVIFDNKHLSLLLGMKNGTLGYYIFNTDNFYTVKYIPKKSSGVRIISMPSYNLKKIQRWILNNILYRIPITKYSTGFVKGKSILDNALPHINKKVVVNLDIKNFFENVKFESVFYIFYNLGYTKEVSYSLSKLLTFKGKLPQGSPASPYISNLILKRLDNKISIISMNNDFDYTRYADDITISGNDIVCKNIRYIVDLIEDEGFKVNSNKVKVLKKNKRQEVTGLVVNNDNVKVKKEVKKQLRQHIYYCKKYGVYNHLKYTKCEDKSFFKDFLYGKANFIFMIEPEVGKKFLNDLDGLDWNS